MKAIIGIDGSKGSLAAVQLAGQILSQQRDTLAFYYAVPEVQVETGAELTPEILTRLRAQLTQVVLDEAEAKLPADWHGRVERIRGQQDPRRGLIVAAQYHHADLIVVGARGLGPVTSWLLGSVSAAVAHASHLPVLIARPRPAERTGPLKLLIACGDLTHVGAVADLLSQFSWPLGTSGRLISVAESPFGKKLPEWLEARVAESAEPDARSWLGRVRAEVQAKRTQLEGTCGKFAWPFQTASPLVVEGDPAGEILEAIDREQADLVVIGTRHPGWATRLLLGSTSEKVLSHAPCSVLLVPHKEHP